METIRALWRKSQVRGVVLLHALSGAGVVIAGMLSDENVKAAAQPVLGSWFGYALLASAVILYLAAPHGEK